MKISSGDSEQAQPHHGLLILGIGAVIVSLFSSLPQGIFSFSAPREIHEGGCLYQLFVDDICLGTIALKDPVTLGMISQAFGFNDTPKEDRTIPCGTAVKATGNPRRYSLEKIPGSHVLKAGKKIDINCAGTEDLQAVPGIGPVLAERIVRHRKQHGAFAEVEGLVEMGGISRKRVKVLEPFLRAGNSGCDPLEDVEPVARFVDPSIRRHQEELPCSHEIGKRNSDAY